ncbi:MAG: DMT family transporter [Actinomycetota bacterium]|nr:DMT family transporter [Actinomycetota bacterium]
MAILLALFSALSYGVSDFVGGLVSRRTSAWSVAFVAQVSAMTFSIFLALLTGGSPVVSDLAWAILAGIGSAAGIGFLYRGLATGRMSVVAPVSAVGSAIVPGLVGALTGERPSALVWTGVLLALPSIWLVAHNSAEQTEAASTEEAAGRAAGAFVDGLLAGVGFGVLFAALGQVRDEAGLWPVATGQAVSVLGLVLLATVLRAPWVPRDTAAAIAVVAGALGASANVAFLLSAQYGFLTVAGVLASLYPAATVLLAAVVLHERIRRGQGVGLGLCAVAIALVAAG